jgi:hypothetical protein
LASDKIDQAFSLLEMAHLKPERKEFLSRKIHKRAVFYCLAEFDLNRCKECMKASNIDLREVSPTKLCGNLLVVLIIVP